MRLLLLLGFAIAQEVANHVEEPSCEPLVARVNQLQADIDVYGEELKRCSANHGMAEDMLTDCHDSLEREKRAHIAAVEKLEQLKPLELEVQRLKPFELKAQRLESEVEQLREEVGRLKSVASTVEQYESQVKKLESDIRQMDKDTKLAADRSTSRISELSSEISRLSGLYESAETDVKSLMTKLHAAEEKAEIAELAMLQRTKELPLTWDGVANLAMSVVRVTKGTGIVLFQKTWTQVPPTVRAVIEEKYDQSASFAVRSVGPQLRRLQSHPGISKVVRVIKDFVLGRLHRVQTRLQWIIHDVILSYIEREIIPRLSDDVKVVLPAERSGLAIVFGMVAGIFYIIAYTIGRMARATMSGILTAVCHRRKKTVVRKISKRESSPDSTNSALPSSAAVASSATTKPSPRKRKTRR